MSAREIAAALGNARREGRNWRCVCPVHGGTSLSIASGRHEQLLVHCFAGCDWRDVFAALRAQGLLGDQVRDVNVDLDRQAKFRRRREAVEKVEIERVARAIGLARDLYRRGEPATGTIVETYLRSRGISLPMPSVLRFLQHCPHRNGKYYPAIVAPIVNVHGEMVAVHKTFLAADGCAKADLPKREQREVHGPMKGGAVRLEQPRRDVPLLVAEGLESTLAAAQLFGLPGWAAIYAGGIETIELADDVIEVVIAADRDANGVGQRAALRVRERWMGEGRSVRILLSPNVGEDFNDVLLGTKQNGQ